MLLMVALGTILLDEDVAIRDRTDESVSNADEEKAGVELEDSGVGYAMVEKLEDDTPAATEDWDLISEE